MTAISHSKIIRFLVILVGCISAFNMWVPMKVRAFIPEPPGPGGCIDASDCPHGEYCWNGNCLPASDPECTHDSDCGSCEHCSHEECVRDCSQASQCGSGFDCVDGCCVETGPQPGGDCSCSIVQERCGSNVTIMAPGVLDANLECIVGTYRDCWGCWYVCDLNNKCRYISQCGDVLGPRSCDNPYHPPGEPDPPGCVETCPCTPEFPPTSGNWIANTPPVGHQGKRI